MPFVREHNFNPDVRWYSGAGCMNCGRNQSASGGLIGYQCIDLGVDEFEGRIGLCTDCAREVGRLANMVPLEQVEARADQVTATLTEAIAEREAAEALQAQNRQDKDTIERLIYSVSADAE